MVLIKKRDVESYFASRRPKGTRMFRPVSQPNATGFSEKSTGRAAVNAENSAGDTLAQPTSSGEDTSVSDVAPSSCGPLKPFATKSAQA